MSQDIFEERRKSLEEQFFSKHNEALVSKLRDAAQKQASKDELRQLTGIANEQVLDALASLKVGGAATLVMSLYPMIEVAWADGEVDARERTTILKIADSVGLAHGSAAYSYLEQWLSEKPEPAWHRLWADYVTALCAHLKPDDLTLLKASVLGRARVVAEASGGLMGFLWSVSQAEQRVLNNLEAAFR